jgi:signal peptidase II
LSQRFRKARVFWPLLSIVLLTDCATKRWAEANLVVHQPEPVVGEVLRWTLAYNKLGAMGLSLGSASRPLLVAAAIIALVGLLRLYWLAGPRDKVVAIAAALVAGGALGNLFDRVRWTGGVVDFIDVGLGPRRFWIFNIADVGVTVGAVMLAWAIWRREQEAELASSAASEESHA